MAMTKPEETFHNYLRKHFEKVSQDRVRKFAEQGLGSKVDLCPSMRSPDGSAGNHN
jgi:hypothetical protein